MYDDIKENIKKLSESLAVIQAKARDEGRALTAQEAGLVTELEAAINDERKSLPVNSPLTLQNTLGGETSQSAPAGKKDYRSMFSLGRNLQNGGFKNFNEFLTVMASGKFDDRLKNSASETVPSEGGFFVPEQFASGLLDASLEDEIIRPRATVYPMKSDSLKAPGWNSSDHSNSLFGGLTATWLGELAAAVEVTAKTRQIELIAKKLACFTSASNELVADGINYETQLQQAIITTIGWYMDYAFIAGTGAGQPLGILNDPSLIKIPKESGQTTKTITYDNVIKMYSRLAPQCMKNAIWSASQTAIPQMLTLSILIGLAGSAVPAVIQQNGKFFLLGKEVIFTEKVPALGSLGDIILCDPSQYIVGMRKEVSLDKSIHVGWSVDSMCYRTIVRVDGQGSWDKAITPKAGDSLSWCVALAAR
jgi:HK97 family phage major capsid protein